MVTAISAKFHTIHRRKFMPNVFPTKLPAKGLLTFRSCEKKMRAIHFTVQVLLLSTLPWNLRAFCCILSLIKCSDNLEMFVFILGTFHHRSFLHHSSIYNALNKNINIYLSIYIYIFIYSNRDSANFVAILWCLGKYSIVTFSTAEVSWRKNTKRRIGYAQN